MCRPEWIPYPLWCVARFNVVAAISCACGQGWSGDVLAWRAMHCTHPLENLYLFILGQIGAIYLENLGGFMIKR